MMQHVQQLSGSIVEVAHQVPLSCQLLSQSSWSGCDDRTGHSNSQVLIGGQPIFGHLQKGVICC